ncbi:MAG TPA: ASKHA domain-containing protein [Bryobacteraceae bacterium]|nr:ASKHA domain-containing protein [Bryobacteraceae bacterium]
MPSVRFLPADVAVDVAAGTLIHEAAVRAGLLDLELPCGGQGTCGQCLVEVADQPVMACQTRVSADIVVRIPENRDVAIRVVGDSHFLVNEELLPSRDQISPLVRMERVTVSSASVEEHYSDWKRLVRALRQPEATAPLPVLQSLAAVLRERDGQVTVALEDRQGGARVAGIYPGHAPRPAMGLALDIGTTTVAAQLVDLEDGRVVDTRTSYNLQIRRGADIITRIDYARTPERLEELRSLVLESANTLIAQMPADHGDIRAAFIAGNTTMIHLLLGLPPRYIRESPYVPTVNPVPAMAARDVGLEIHPDAPVEFAPGVGSYVGGDITAGLLSTELPTNAGEVFLFLDIGTNGEIVIGNAAWMVACACSAGPAFEGSGIKCGMRAAEGAIEHVEIGETLRYKVIGGGKPAGICGSGLICLLGELFRRGIIDQSGRFHIEPREFLLESGARTATGEDLVITESDLENLIRTKAAIYAACSLILENVGLNWEAIARVYIAGGFGRYIEVAEAVRIGMLPDLPHGRFSYIGNSALTGAYIALLSGEHRRRLADIAGRITYVDLSSDPRYMDNYVKAMFLPHTDLEKFPTVAGMLTQQRRIGL